MGYCKIHGEFFGEYCRDCSAAENRVGDELEEIRGLLTERSADHEKLLKSFNNPGNYFCPHCKWKTLLYRATRCRCGGEISKEYWQKEDERREAERAELLRQAEEDKKKGREKEERLQRESAKRARIQQDEANGPSLGCVFFFVTLVVLAALVIWALPSSQERLTDTPAKAIYTEDPKPDGTWRPDKVQEVLVVFTVDIDGTVKDAEVRETTDPQLAEPALAAIRRWRFEPTMVDGSPVATRQEVRMGWGPRPPPEN